MSAFLISREDMIAEAARVFDQLRSGSQVCYLIRHDAHTKKFAVVKQIESGFFVSWDKFREQMLLRVATADAAFANEQSETSFVAYGTPDADGDVDVYAIREPERDKVSPNESSPCWKFYLERDEKQRFTVPE